MAKCQKNKFSRRYKPQVLFKGTLEATMLPGGGGAQL